MTTYVREQDRAGRADKIGHYKTGRTRQNKLGHDRASHQGKTGQIRVRQDKAG